jgi:hypothetical protein
MPKVSNAYKHGAFAKVTVLPWEDQARFDSMYEAFREELQPEGPTEEAIVLEIADVHWRKQRCRFGQMLQAVKEWPSPELIEAAQQGPRELVEYARKQKGRSGGLKITTLQALDLVKKKITRAEIPQSADDEPPPPTVVERAYDPELNLAHLRLEALLETHIQKLYRRLANTKAFKEIEGLGPKIVDAA